jgi:hypothetical protein
VERRQASALRFRARAAPRRVRPLNTRLSAFRLLFSFLLSFLSSSGGSSGSEALRIADEQDRAESRYHRRLKA